MGCGVRVLYDGWPLVREPIEPAGAHLLALLANLPSAVHPVVALPAEPPGFLRRVETVIRPLGDSPQDRLRWEQRILPALADGAQADLLHLPYPSAPLFSRVPCVVSWTRPFEAFNDIHTEPHSKFRTFSSTLGESLGRGGLSRSCAVLFPHDLPQAMRVDAAHFLPPIIHPDFLGLDTRESPEEGNGYPADQPQRIGLPETYILYHGPTDVHRLRRLAEAWSWASGPIGQNYPLLVVGLPDAGQALLADLAQEYNLGSSISPLPPLSPAELPWLYHGCAAVFHPAPASPWSGSVRHALASGKPLVAAENPLTSAVVGPAAYLAPGDDPRALGAAIITVIVEEEVAAQLSRKAVQQAAGWDQAEFGRKLALLYQKISG